MKIRKAKVFLLLGSVLLLAWKISANDDGVTVQTEDDAANDLSYESPYADPVKFYFADHFDDQEEFPSRWIKSQAKKDDTADEIAKYDGEWDVEFPKKPLLPNDLGLVLKSKAKHAAIASRLNRPFVFSDKPLIVQYEVNLQDGQECGGSYIKLLSSGKETTDLKQFRDKTPYTIMFGPDKCGNDIKLHFIFRHVNPMNGTITEKHCRKAKDRLDEPFKDKQPHLYQLVVRPDNTYTIRVDHKTVNEGSLFTEFMPPVNPPKEIDDPNDFKPENWDEREKIPDPDAKKPDDWNEDEPPQIPDPNASKPEEWLDDVEEMISDPNAEKPADWDVDMDGEWEAPLIVNPACEKVVGCGLWKAPVISNPNYKGKWRAPLIDNPNYQGKWAPRKIPNPDFFEDKSPFKMTTIAAIGIELWSMSSDILFDNLIIVDDETLARDWAAQTYDLKRKLIGREANTLWDRAMKYMGYKPGYWFAYFVYCSIPVIAYIWFLLKRRDKERLCDIIPNITIQNSVDSSAYYHMVSGCFEMQKYIDRIEAIQRKFVRYALRNLPWKDPVNLPPYEDRCQLLGLETLEQRRKNAKTVFVAKLLNAELDAPNLLALIDINIPGYSLRTAEFLRLPRWRQDYDGNEPVRAMMRNFNAVYNLYDFNETSIQFRSKLRRMN